MRQIFRWSLLCGTLLLGSCGADVSWGPTERAWSEDVLLEDGSTLLVKRAVKFNETNSLGGGAYNAVEMYSTIAFTGELASLQPWDQALIALVLYRDANTSEWVLVATTSSCNVWQDRGQPDPMYWEFRLSPKGWRETPLSLTSIGKPVNLLVRYQPPLPSSHITVAVRQRLEANPVTPERYLHIVTGTKIRCTRRTPTASAPAALSPSKTQ